MFGFDFNVPFKRISSDYCFYGSKGSGKTIAMSYFGLYFYLKGYTIFSNYHLIYPHVYIKSIEDILSMSHGMCLMDDFERWSSSKFLSNKDKSNLLECTLNFGKNSVSPFVWSTKRPAECDKTIRFCVDKFIKCSLILKYIPSSYEEYEYMSGFLDAHKIQLEVFDAMSLKCEEITFIDDLDLYSMLYDTTEVISKLKKDDIDSPGKFGREEKHPKIGFFNSQNIGNQI